MNLLNFALLTRNHINRTVLPGAKRIASQAMLGIKKAVGENLFKLLFRLACNYALHQLMYYLVERFIR